MTVVGFGCPVDFDPIQPGDRFPEPTPTDEPTPAPPIEVVPTVTDGLLMNPDGGWVASAGSESWSALTDRAGGDEPFSVASVIEFRGSLAEWLAPGDGSDPTQATTGAMASAVQAALDNGRYVALRLVGVTPSDLPASWPTSTDAAALLPDGIISLVGVPVGDDDDSAGDDDDSAGDDDDSARGDVATGWVNVADPDWIQYQQVILSELSGRFAGEPGLAFVTVGGVGTEGTWQLPEQFSWFGSAGQAAFTEPSWVATVGFYSELYRGSFGAVPAFIGWTVLREAGSSASQLSNVLAGDEISIRDDCFGGCSEPDFDRFPDEGSGDPYPSSDPYGGWLIAEYEEALGAAAAGGLGGLGAWRAAEAAGTWDSGSFGGVQSYLERMMDVRVRYAPPLYVSLGDDACASEYAVASSPSGPLCSNQSGGPWSPLLDLGPSIGPRLHISRVAMPGNWYELDTFDLQVDLANASTAAPRSARTLELAFRTAEGADLATVTFDEDALDAPGLTATRELVAAVQLDPTPTSGQTIDVVARLPMLRSFDGWLRMPHSGVDAQGWYPVATLTVPTDQ
jgi:hypothetical protein